MLPERGREQEEMALELLQFMKQREERACATWQRRRDIPLAILAWTAVVALILWGAEHIVRSLLILTLAALLAYALASRRQALTAQHA